MSAEPLELSADGSFDTDSAEAVQPTARDASKPKPKTKTKPKHKSRAKKSSPQGSWMDACAKAKTEGNAHFKAGRFKAALTCYRAGIDEIPNGTVDPAVRELGAAVNNNAAAAQLKLNNAAGAVVYSSNALVLDARNPKAFHRRGLAHAALGEHAKAARDFEEALRLPLDGPSERAARKAMRESKQVLAAAFSGESDGGGGGGSSGSGSSSSGGGGGGGNGSGGGRGNGRGNCQS